MTESEIAILKQSPWGTLCNAFKSFAGSREKGGSRRVSVGKQRRESAFKRITLSGKKCHLQQSRRARIYREEQLNKITLEDSVLLVLHKRVMSVSLPRVPRSLLHLTKPSTSTEG